MSKIIIIGLVSFLTVIIFGTNAKEIHEKNIQTCLQNSDYSRIQCEYYLK